MRHSSINHFGLVRLFDPLLIWYFFWLLVPAFVILSAAKDLSVVANEKLASRLLPFLPY
jgi:hypothetical protein